MTSRYDAKYLRGNGLRRRPLASPSHAEIDPCGTCPSAAAHRRARRRVRRQWSPHSTPGSGGTRAHTIRVDPGTVAPPHWSQCGRREHCGGPRERSTNAPQHPTGKKRKYERNLYSDHPIFVGFCLATSGKRVGKAALEQHAVRTPHPGNWQLELASWARGHGCSKTSQRALGCST